MNAIVAKFHHGDTLPLQPTEKSQRSSPQFWVERLGDRHHRHAAGVGHLFQPPVLESRNTFALVQKHLYPDTFPRAVLLQECFT